MAKIKILSSKIDMGNKNYEVIFLIDGSKFGLYIVKWSQIKRFCDFSPRGFILHKQLCVVLSIHLWYWIAFKLKWKIYQYATLWSKKFLEKYLYCIILLSLEIFIYPLCAVHKSVTFFPIEGVVINILIPFFQFLKQ